MTARRAALAKLLSVTAAGVTAVAAPAAAGVCEGDTVPLENAFGSLRSLPGNLAFQRLRAFKRVRPPFPEKIIWGPIFWLQCGLLVDISQLRERFKLEEVLGRELRGDETLVSVLEELQSTRFAERGGQLVVDEVGRAVVAV